ncbi:Calx-beta domain-containing protein [Candidatus Parabeggiatoa sp. HSG14]|uniref:Calx-beta domain-containing protein n=1 Tax=Candidatus Parabeggiatoa sp. HSG14 TaxID=3055593 RepID=UPI0025A784CC|nr:Calx-beta domain-containing protein [Thiotrichales bacterium HSG14]
MTTLLNRIFIGAISIILSSLVLVTIPVTTTFAAAPIAGFGTALDFDGVNDYVECGDILPTSYTKEAWVKRGDGNFPNNIISGKDGANPGSVFYVPSKYNFKLSSGHNGRWNYVQDSEMLQADIWYHVAVTYHAGEMKLYKNGLLADHQLGVPAFISNRVNIGKYGSGKTKGQIDEVRIWNVARTQAEIQANMYTPLQGNESGLVALYDFEDHTGTTATDHAGSNHGTLTNMDEVDWVDGNINVTFTTDKNTPFSETLSGYDVDGDTLKYSIVSQGSKGTASITNVNTGAFTYTPYTNVIGTDTFTYKVNDGISDSNIATVTINILDNNAPVATDITLTTVKTLSGYDVDGDTLKYSIVSQGSKGTAFITNVNTGAFIYTPDTNVIGTDTFTYKVNDGTSDSNIATVTINILDNNAPVATDITLTTGKNRQLSETLDGYDADSNTLNYSIVNQGSKGDALITNTGVFTYTPNINVIGTDTFTYQINDGTLDSNIATVTINILNNAPIAGFGTTLDFDGVDDYVVIPNYKGITGSNARTIEAWINTSHKTSTKNLVTWGNVLNVNQSWDFQVQRLNGFLKVQITSSHIIGSTAVNDGQWHHVACTFENDGSPDITDVKLYVDGQLDTLSSFKHGSVNTKDNGIDVEIGHGYYNKYFKDQIDEVQIWNVARTQSQIQTDMYQIPAGNEAGLQAYYTFNDGSGNILTNQTANHDALLVNMDSNTDWVESSPVLYSANLNTVFNGMLVGSDLDGDALTYRIVGNPSHGAITLTNPATGAFTYTPDDWYQGVDTFTYQLNDGSKDSNQETATINITPPSYSTGTYQNGQTELVELTIPKATSLIVSISGETELDSDWLEILQSDSTSFSPPQKFSGVIEENFVVTGENTIKVLFASNDSITKSGATVTINILPQVYSSDKVCDTNSSLIFSETDFVDNFIDPTGNGLDTVKIFSEPNSGELTLSGTAISMGQAISRSDFSQLKYTPNPNYIGQDSFKWSGSNVLTNGNSTNQASVNILVQTFVELNGTSMDLATAIQQVNSNAQDNTITFLKDIQLFATLPVITGTVHFQGNNHSISGNNQHQVFFVDGGIVHFSDLTIQDGQVRGGTGGAGANDIEIDGNGGGGGGGGGMGGAIFSNTGSQVIVENITFLNNQALGGNGGDGGGYSGHFNGELGYDGFQQIGQIAFGSGAGGGGSPNGQGNLSGNNLHLGKGGHGNNISNGNIGNSGDSNQMLGIGGGGGGASLVLNGGAGGDGGFGAGSGGSGSHGTDTGTISQAGTSGEFGGQGGSSNFQHAGGGGGGSGLGGAIFVRTGSTLTLINSIFTNNTATGGNGGNGTEVNYDGINGQGQGGAIFIQTGAAVISEGDLTLTGNTASTAKPDIKGLLRPTISVVAGPTLAKETGALAGTFVISSAAYPQDNTISFSVDGTATLGTDYTITGATLNGSNGTILMPAMPNNSVTLTITPIDDSEGDPDETIQLILNQGATYQLAIEANTAILTIQDNDSLTSTGLYLETSASTILNNDKLDVVGKLSRFQETEDNLVGQPIVLTITAPDGITQETLNVNVLTDTGQFRFDDLELPNIFTTSMQDGAFGFQASFSGTDELAASTSEAEMVLVGASAGYAILVQGKIQNEEGLAAHNKTIHRIYKKFRDRGFEDDNLKYFNYDTTQEGVDGLPIKADIAAAFTELQSRINSNPAPFYVVMIDHGGIDGTFHIYNGNNNANDVITPADLGGWLDNLETGLNANALKKSRLVTLGACYSGSFIPVISQSGRTIITSATAQEESYKGLEEPDGIRSGEYFMEEFFASLGRSNNLKAAFEFATEKTEIFTRRGDGNIANRFYDEATQHPLLDDNGDGQGSNTFTANVGSDGLLAQDILLGIGLNYDTNSAENPAEILSVSNTIYLSATESAAILEAMVNNADTVNSAPVDIRKPSVILNSSGTETSEQLEITNLPRVFLVCDSSNVCLTNFNQFEEPGMYEAFYFVRDSETNDISPVKRSVIYKNYPNNQPPSAFDLIEPQDNSEHKTTLLFKWESTTDADGPVTYNFIIGKDSSFTEIVYQQEELATAMTYVDDTVPLDKENPTTYYWKVEAVDPFGERTSSSSIFAFTTNNTNAPPGISSLHISSALDFQAINGAEILLFDEDGNPLPNPEIYQDQGHYNILSLLGRRRAKIQVAGYEAQDIELETTQETTQLNVEMMPVGGIPIQPGELQFSASESSIDETEGTATILVERVEGNDTEVTVDYTMADGSALADSDYTSSSGTLTWLDKDERTKTINLSINDDPDFEGDETFTITLSNPTGGTAESPAKLGATSQITVTIVDDEAAPEPVPGTLQFSANTYSATEGDSTLNLNVIRTEGSDGEVSVQYIVSGTAALNTDYNGGTGTLTWNDGDSTTKSLTFSLIDDDEVEETETLTLRLFEPTGNATLGNPAQATLTIVDNDVAIEKKEEKEEKPETKATPDAVMTPETKAIPESTVTPVITPEPVIIAEPVVTPMVMPETMVTTPDMVITEQVTPTPITTPVINQGIITSPSEAGILQFASTTYLAKETDGELQSIMVTRTDGHLGEVSVQYLVTGASIATPSKDYIIGNGMLTWAEGETQSKALPITLVEDGESEALETVNFMLLNATGQAVLGRLSQSTLVIIDSALVSGTTAPVTITPELEPENIVNANAGTLQFLAPFYTTNEGIGNLTTFTVTRREGSNGEVSVAYTIDGGSALLDYDYVGGTGELVWKNGDTTPKSIALMILDDKQIEDLETISLILSEPTGGVTLGVIRRASLIVVDNDGQDIPNSFQDSEDKSEESEANSKEENEVTSNPEEEEREDISLHGEKETGRVSSQKSEFVFSSLPNLGRGIAVAKDGSMLSANALFDMVGITVAFRGGVSINRQEYQSSLTTTPAKMVKITGEIDIAEVHISQEADILVVVGIIDNGSIETHGSASLQFLMLDNQAQFQVWEGELATLVGNNVVLSETQTIEIYHGFIKPVQAQIYFGYRLKENGTIYFNGEQPIEVRIKEDYDNHAQQPQMIWQSAFSPNGEQIITASSGGKIYFWESSTGHRLSYFNLPITDVEYAAFSMDSQIIATASNDNMIHLWEVADGTPLIKLIGHEEIVKHISFSTDGQQIVTTSWDNTARLWEVKTGEALLVLKHQAIVEHAAFSPDGKQVITTSWDNTARLWEVDTGQEILTLTGHRNGVSHATFSPEGKYIATTSWDNSVRLWDTKTGKAVWIREHQAGVNHAAFSPDGQMIVTGSNDGTARLWKTATGEPLKTLKGHKSNVWHVGFSPDGKRVISASWDDTVRVWEVETGELLTVLKD